MYFTFVGTWFACMYAQQKRALDPIINGCKKPCGY